MIKSFILNNFKSHKTTELRFSNLTVLCGNNGVGKSSVIQALLLLRESFFDKSNSNFEYLNLKSDAVSIGTVNDALYQFNENDELGFELEIEGKKDKAKFRFRAQERDYTPSIIRKSPNGHEGLTDLESINLFDRNCQYISAARQGPLSSYEKDDAVVDVRNQISIKEGRAEYFVHFLDKNRNREVLHNLCKKNSPNDLFSQTNAWESLISDKVNIVVQDIGNLGYELKYQFNTLSDRTNEFKASNVGFGLTYTMPIIVAILSAPKGSLILIENPEAHLHPYGQARMAELISLAAQAGIQIIVETHSDHIINGILVQVKNHDNGDGGIDKSNVSIYQFDFDKVGKHYTTNTEIEIQDGGTIIYPPDGFFDQFTIDRKKIIGF